MISLLHPVQSESFDQFLEEGNKIVDAIYAETKGVDEMSAVARILPPRDLIFNSLKLCPFDKVRVVILGQDCYINPGEANGLAFSVNKGVLIPPSLKNIFLELKASFSDFIMPTHGDLSSWSSQGVLLLNSSLTVLRGRSGSHMHHWATFTDKVIKFISDNRPPGVVFLLWGNHAKGKRTLIDVKKHHILESVHPSPLAGHNFIGNKHFISTNKILVAAKKPFINWNLQ